MPSWRFCLFFLPNFHYIASLSYLIIWKRKLLSNKTRIANNDYNRFFIAKFIVNIRCFFLFLNEEMREHDDDDDDDDDAEEEEEVLVDLHKSY